MFGANSANAMRMLRMLHQSNEPAPEPRASLASPEPIRKTVPRPAAKAPAQRRRAPTPPVSAYESDSYSDSDSDSLSSESSYSSYEDVDTIYHHVVEDKKCPYVSPAGLKDKKTSRDAIEHLKTKKCPEVSALKKKKAVVAAPPSPKAPTKAEAEAVRAPKTKRTKTVKTMEPAASETAAPAPQAPSAPAAVSTEKKKRAPSAYNLFVSQQRKAGKTMAEAASAWRAKKGEATA